MKISTTIGRSGAKRFYRITAKSIYTESQQHYTTNNLKKNLVFKNQFIHKAHAVPCYQGVTYIA